ncbi:MAG: hypothetical protein AAB573_04150 [Patescibacteria group bacterium]
MAVLDKKFLGAPVAHPEQAELLRAHGRRLRAVPGRIGRSVYNRSDALTHAARAAGENSAAINGWMAAAAERIPTGLGKFTGRLAASALSLPVTPVVYGATYLVEGFDKTVHGRPTADQMAHTTGLINTRRAKYRANSAVRM